MTDYIIQFQHLVTWRTRGPLKGSDVTTAGDGDVAGLVGFGVGDEHDLA